MNSIQVKAFLKRKLPRWILNLRKIRHFRVIFDMHPYPRHSFMAPYRIDYRRHQLSLSYIKSVVMESTGNRSFLNIGGRDGQLGELWMDGSYSLKCLNEDFQYYAVDLLPLDETVLAGDICSPDFLVKYRKFGQFFDVVYSNNLFEHLENPFVAAQNIWNLLKPGGVCITVAPFAWRYHECPDDYFRYSHRGLVKLFEYASKGDLSEFKILESGYDLQDRRENRTGNKTPLDSFGGWREHWHSILIFQKKPVSDNSLPKH